MDKAKRLKKSAEYDKANTKGLYLKLNKKTDADIIEALNNCYNKQGYIKALIRRDLNKAAIGGDLLEYFDGTREA